MLRLSLEADPAERARLPLRQGRAIAWIEEALAWLTDIGGLSRDDAAELMRWSARALLQSAVDGNPTRGGNLSG